MLQHLVEAVLAEEGFATRRFYAGRDVVRKYGGCRCPELLRCHAEGLLSVSVGVVGAYQGGS